MEMEEKKTTSTTKTATTDKPKKATRATKAATTKEKYEGSNENSTNSTNSLKLLLNIQVVYINKSYPLPKTTEMYFEACNSHQGASVGTFINTLKSQKSFNAIRTITS